jgi:hypothetical protein
MILRVLLLLCACLLCLGALLAPISALAVDSSDPGYSGPDTSSYISDYRAIRKLGMALAVVGFMIGVTRMATTEMPHDRMRAQRLLMLTMIVFVLLAGDRMLAQGVSGWFELPLSALPVFWQ